MRAAAGNLGQDIVRHYAREGAVVVMTGRTPERLEAARAALEAETGVPPERLAGVILDGADPGSVRDGIAEAVARFGRIDILVNNAGSAGPKQRLADLPLSQADLFALQKAGATDAETVHDALRNLLGVTWNVARAAAPHMPPGSSMINVSTIFSRTPYFGRTAYVVPKAALNALSRELSLELGPRGIRVNLLFPGPIESERIRTVFAAMDRMRGDPPGTARAGASPIMRCSSTACRPSASRASPSMSHGASSRRRCASSSWPTPPATNNIPATWRRARQTPTLPSSWSTRARGSSPRPVATPASHI